MGNEHFVVSGNSIKGERAISFTWEEWTLKLILEKLEGIEIRLTAIEQKLADSGIAKLRRE